jgi:hypothetical protein
MSEENVEIIRRAIDAWNRRDMEALNALMPRLVPGSIAVGELTSGTKLMR